MARAPKQRARGVLGQGIACQRVAAGDLAQEQSASPRRERLLELGERPGDVQVAGAGRLGELLGAQRVARQEEQRFERAGELAAHARVPALGRLIARTVISPNGSA